MGVTFKCNVCGDEIPLDQDDDVAFVEMVTFSAAHRSHARFSVDLHWGTPSDGALST